jgi:hypothetical protein
MSDDPGDYSEEELERLLKNYLTQNLDSAKRIKNILLPVCLNNEAVTREKLKKEFVKSGEANNERSAGYFLSIISQQIGMAKNDFLRQVIGYGYPNNPWEKDNYHIRDGYRNLVSKVLKELNENEFQQNA